MLLKNKLDKITFFLLCILIVLFPINYKIGLSLRIFDIVYIFTFFLFLFTTFKVQKIYVVLVLFIICILIISTWNGYLKTKSIDVTRIIFVYKYFIIFSVPMLVSNIMNTPYRVKAINRFMLCVFIALLAWVYLYLMLNYFEIINGNKRPSFPFSENIPGASCTGINVAQYPGCFCRYLDNGSEFQPDFVPGSGESDWACGQKRHSYV